MAPPFQRLLIANRGEIACRVARTCRALGIRAIAVYSEADAQARHVQEADAAYPIGPAPAPASYLNSDVILAAAKESGAEAVHPGYGFLSENAEFARRCGEAGLVFIGPTPAAIAAMGDKAASRQTVQAVGVPVLHGSDGTVSDVEHARGLAETIGYPIMVKPSGGGGGMGMKVVRAPEELPAAFEAAQRVAERAFGRGDILIERYLDRPRHVEAQILADQHGATVFLGERDCSVQRRHQKVIEETPSPAVDAPLRQAMAAAALKAAAAIDYRNAGTVECLVDQHGGFYFLEMNTRLQVEHTVTEMVTGLDLVAEQIYIAAGRPLRFAQADIKPQGHAIECRVYAEDPKTFFPAPGTITAYEEPTGEHVRVDSGVLAGQTVTMHYDPLLAKLIVWGSTRAEAIQRMAGALDGFVVEGVKTNLPLLRQVMANTDFAAGDYGTNLLLTMGLKA